MSDSPRPAPRHLERLERWLTNPLTRALLVAGFVAVMAAFGVAQAYDSFGQRFGDWPVEIRDEYGINFGWLYSFARFGLYWGLWGLAAVLIVPSGLWLAAKFQSWLLFLALQLPLSFGVGWGVGELHTLGVDSILGASPESEAVREFFESRRFPRGGDGESRRRGEDGRPEDGSRGAEGADRAQADEARPDGPRTDATRADATRAAGERQGDGRRGDGRRAGRGGGGFRPPTESALGGAPRGLFAYWFVLALGAGAHLFLRGRMQERRSAELTLAAAGLETELATARLATLKNQLHPHFLFNSLHSVGGLIRADQKSGALTALANIGDLLRKTLDIGDEQELSLAEEVELTRRYLAVEQVRLGERLRSTIELPSELRDASVPALLLLPIVENAVRHGIAPLTAGGALTVRARAVNDRLELTVEDDGGGYDPEGNTRTKGNGIGLANTRARLAALYADAAELRIESPDAGGTRVVVTLPLET